MWRYFSASTTGLSHERVGLPCQDRSECKLIVGGWLLIAVSDGAGSAKHADEGAQTAVSSAIEHLTNTLTTGVAPALAIQGAFEAAREAMYRRADELEEHVRELSATLLLAALSDREGAAGQIGDGVIAVRADPEEWCYIYWPQNGEYANVTRFVTDDDATEWFQCGPLEPGIQEIAAITDGLEPLALQFSTKSVHSKFFEGFASRLREGNESGNDEQLSKELCEFLVSPAVRSRVDDDLTLVIASRCDTDAIHS